MHGNRLTSCPECASPLLRPEWFVGPADAGEIIVRACPECSHRDTVVAPTDAAATWRRVEARQRVQLASSLLVLEVEAWLAGRTAEGPTASAA